MADERWRSQLVFSRQKGRGELDEVAQRLGIEGTNFSKLGLKLNGRRMAIELEYEASRRHELDDLELIRSRRLIAVNLCARFERAGQQDQDVDTVATDAPSIELRRESASDVSDKRRGLTKELQTGFPGFDRNVFIDNDSSEEDARRILSKEATRQAVLRLLDAGHPRVTITTTSVTVRQPVEGERVNVEALFNAMEDLLIVARADGPKGARPPRRGENTGVLLVAGAVLAALYAFVTWRMYSGTFLAILIGAVIGGVAGFFTRPVIDAHVSGDSGSGRRAWQMLLCVIVLCGALCSGAIVHGNVAFDSSEPELRRGTVARVWTSETTRKGRSTEQQYVDVRMHDGALVTLPWGGPARVGDHYVEVVHAGAFGFEWIDGRNITAR